MITVLALLEWAWPHPSMQNEADVHRGVHQKTVQSHSSAQRDGGGIETRRMRGVDVILDKKESAEVDTRQQSNIQCKNLDQ